VQGEEEEEAEATGEAEGADIIREVEADRAIQAAIVCLLQIRKVCRAETASCTSRIPLVQQVFTFPTARARYGQTDSSHLKLLDL